MGYKTASGNLAFNCAGPHEDVREVLFRSYKTASGNLAFNAYANSKIAEMYSKLQNRKR